MLGVTVVLSDVTVRVGVTTLTATVVVVQLPVLAASHIL